MLQNQQNQKQNQKKNQQKQNQKSQHSSSNWSNIIDEANMINNLSLSRTNLQALNDNIINNYVQRHSSQQNQSNQSNSSNNFKSLDQNIVFEDNALTFRWNAVDIEFFDFFYDDKLIHIDELIVYSIKNIYFRDVYIFINRVNDLIVVKKVESIRENFWTYLRNIILAWWIDELTNNEKRITKFIVNINDKLKR